MLLLYKMLHLKEEKIRGRGNKFQSNQVSPSLLRSHLVSLGLTYYTEWLTQSHHVSLSLQNVLLLSLDMSLPIYKLFSLLHHVSADLHLALATTIDKYIQPPMRSIYIYTMVYVNKHKKNVFIVFQFVHLNGFREGLMPPELWNNLREMSRV